MSELKVYNFKKKKMLVSQKYDYLSMKEFMPNNLLELLGVTCIKKDFSICSEYENIEVIGYDESYRLVLIEYRRESNGSVVRKSFMVIDYIRANMSKVKLALKDYISKDIFKMLDFNPRLIVIGNNFNAYDAYGIKQTHYEVDLIKVRIFSDIIILEKNYQSIKDAVNNKSSNILFKEVHEYILSLGDEVAAYGNESFVIYRTIKNFLYLIIKNEEVILTLPAINKKLVISKTSDLVKAYKTIYKAYEEN